MIKSVGKDVRSRGVRNCTRGMYRSRMKHLNLARTYMRIVVIALVVLTLTCTNDVDVDSGMVEEQSLSTAGLDTAEPPPPPPLTPEEEAQERKELASLAAFREKMERGEANDELDAVVLSDWEKGQEKKKLTSYEPKRGWRASALQLARMTVSEATSLMPLSTYWKLDMQAVLQVAIYVQRPGESLLRTLRRLSPHIARIKEYTRPRQWWTSTLQARGERAPELWIECTSWVVNSKGRKRGLPKGCNGVWRNGVNSWLQVREYAQTLVRMDNPPKPVQGNPKAFGGKMDLYGFLKNRPHLCWLESGPTTTFYLGSKNDPANKCKLVTRAMVKESKVISVAIMKRGMKINRRRNANRTTRRHPNAGRR